MLAKADSASLPQITHGPAGSARSQRGVTVPIPVDAGLAGEEAGGLEVLSARAGLLVPGRARHRLSGPRVCLALLLAGGRRDRLVHQGDAPPDYLSISATTAEKSIGAS